MGFFPFEIEDSARFFPEHDLVACNSGIYAGKSRDARNTFNAKVTAYHIGRVWFKMRRPDLASRIEHLRDINREHLGLSHAEFAGLLAQLPARIPGNWYLIVSGDDADEIWEVDEGNNLVVRGLEVQYEPAADLVVAQVGASPLVSMPEETVTVEWTVANQGPVAVTSNWSSRIELVQGAARLMRILVKVYYKHSAHVLDAQVLDAKGPVTCDAHRAHHL